MKNQRSNNWTVKRLDEVTTLIKDGTHGTHKNVIDGIPLLSAKDIVDGKIQLTNDPRRISVSDYEKIHKNYSLQVADILLTVVGTIGRLSIVKDLSTKFTIQRSVAIVRFDESINPEFAYQYFQSWQFQKSLVHSAQGLAQSGVYLGELGKKKIPVPTLKIQQKISHTLSTIDNAIEKNDQIIQKTEKLKQGLMNELLTRGIGHKKFKKTKLGKIPEGWEVLSLQEMLDREMITSHLDGNHGELYPKSTEFTDAGVPYISANNILGKRVDFTHSKHLSELRAKQFKKGVAIDGDVLFAHNATVGPVALLKTNHPFVILSTSLTYYRCDPSLLKPAYLLNYMQSDMFKNQYQRIMSQTTRNQVPITAQRKLFHVVPPLEEQKTIASILSRIDKQTRINIAQKKRLNTLKSGLMQDIFSQKVQIN